MIGKHLNSKHLVSLRFRQLVIPLLVLASCGEEPRRSVRQPGLTPATKLLPAPESLTGEPGDARVTLTWSEVDGAQSYTIFWSAEPGVDTKDVASVRLRVGADLTASLMASRVSTTRQRFVHVFEPGRSVRLDLLKGQAFADGEMLGHDDDSDALTAQWRAFTDMVDGRVPPTPSGREATDTLRLAQQIVQSMRNKT